MSLPKIAVPTFTIELPYSKKKIQARPYVVKEDKILLMAAQDSNPKVIANATRDVVNACVLEDKFDVNDLAAIDGDYLFMRLRAKSVGEVVNLELTCNEPKDDGTNCQESFAVELNIMDLKLHDELKEKRQNVIQLTDDIGVKMKPTSFRATMEASNDEVENSITIIYHSIEQIFDKENVYTPKDFTLKEFIEWIGEIEPKKLAKLSEYINDLPILRLEKEATCPRCKHVHQLKFEEPTSFF